MGQGAGAQPPDHTPRSRQSSPEIQFHKDRGLLSVRLLALKIFQVTMESTEEWQRLNLTNLNSLDESQLLDVVNNLDFLEPLQTSSPPNDENISSTFAPFSRLPIEIRNQIWKAALEARIVKWIRTNDRNVFDVPSKSLAVLSVNRESREAAFFYGEYIRVSTSPRTIYFSPIIDYLFFDPGWIDLVGLQASERRPDPIETLLPEFCEIRNIMVHPNYTEERKTPTVLFEKLPRLERVLVAADEKSIGFHSKYMTSTAYDIDKYYMATARRRISDIKKPYIAVGCLGWVGLERRSMHHGLEDHRQLVAVFENDREMKAHAASLREEEWRFVQERFQQGRPKLTLNFRKQGQDSRRQSSSSGSGVTIEHPPSYSDIAASHGSDSEEAESSTQNRSADERNKRQRVKGKFQKLLGINLRRIDGLPDYAQIV